MGIYGKYANRLIESQKECLQEGVIDTFKNIISSIKKGIVNLIDKINGWLDKHPDSKVAMGLKNILTKLKNLLTKADKIKSKEDAEDVKSEVDKNKEEAEDLMNSKEKIFNDYPNLKNMVDSGSMVRIRAALSGLSYFADRNSFEAFLVFVKYAKEKYPNLFEEDDNKQYETVKNIEGFKKVSSLLMGNFSEKKYNSIIEIGKAIFKN